MRSAAVPSASPPPRFRIIMTAAATAALITKIASPTCAVMEFMMPVGMEGVVKLYLSINSPLKVPENGVGTASWPEYVDPSGVARSDLTEDCPTSSPRVLDVFIAERTTRRMRADPWPGVAVRVAAPTPLTTRHAKLQAEAPVLLMTPSEARHVDRSMAYVNAQMKGAQWMAARAE